MRRREFVMGAAVAIAAPYVLQTHANAATPRLRRDVQSLSPSDPFFVEYGQAVQAMHQLPASDPRNWRHQSLIHLNHCPHGLRDFVHWHRHYILNYELICGQRSIGFKKPANQLTAAPGYQGRAAGERVGNVARIPSTTTPRFRPGVGSGSFGGGARRASRLCST